MASPTRGEPRVLGVIPARGGSKRLPRKNVLPIAGLPLIAHTIRAAQGASRLTDYLVSSDDPEIIDVAKKFGAPVPFVRPPELATDNVRNAETVRHALDFMESASGSPYDVIVLLQPTSPIRTAAHIDQAVDRLWESPLDTLASVKGPFKKPHPMLKGIRNGVLEPFCPGDVDPSAGEPFFLYNASIYAAKRAYFVRERKMTSRREVPLLMDAAHSCDVDIDSDIPVAEAYFAYIASHATEGGR